jgi:hypothetical protein
MKLKMKGIRAYSEDGKKAIKCVTGKIYEVPENVAKQWIAQGDAQEIKPRVSKKTPKPKTVKTQRKIKK